MLLQERLAVAFAPGLGAHVQVLQVEPVHALPGRETPEVKREADDVAIHHGLHQAFAHADMQVLETEDAEHARVDDGLRASGHGLTKC